MTPIMNSKYQLFDMFIRVTSDSICLSGLTPSDLVVLTREIHMHLCTHMHRMCTGVLGTSQCNCPVKNSYSLLCMF